MTKQKVATNPLSSYGLRSFWSFCKPWRFKALLTLTTFTVASVLIAIQPLFMGKLIDSVNVSPINSAEAWWLATILIIFSVGHDMLWRLSETLFRWLLFPISFAYETHLFRQVIRKPYPYFVNKFTGKISSYITGISNEVRELLSDIFFNYTSSVVSIVSVLVIMTSINWQTGLIIAICLILMLITGSYTLKKDMYYQKIETDKNSTKNGHIVDTIANFVNVKAFHREIQEINAISKQQDITLESAKKSFLWGIVFWASMSVYVRTFMWPIVVILNLWMLLQGQITVGQFTTILTTALMFTQSIWEIIWNISQFGLKVSRIEESYLYLFSKSNISNQPSDSQKISTDNRIFDSKFSINNLHFAYPDKPEDKVLCNINLDIKSGEKIGIVGKSGSGKSTLVKLLLNQYQVAEGIFQFDGRPVSSQEVSQHVAYVPQDTTLFHRSIADNIAYASSDNSSRDDIILASKQAEADEFVSKLIDGYDTLVGERGVKLSGGQRQRIAIARALLMNSPILVLDEATSALDSESEILVQKALENLWENKTVLAIAHRLSTLRNMDRIVVLADGKIVEQGSHDELLQKQGAYAKLWRHQSGGFIEE